MKILRVFSVASVCLIIVVAYGLSFSQPNKSTEYSSDPQAIIDEVSSRGARAVILELYTDSDVWYSVLRKIATGDELWLKAAVALRSGSDAGVSHSLDVTVGEALEHAPEQVLRIASQSFGLRTICGGPDVDDIRYDSYELSMQAIERRKKRVAAISDSDLKSTRDKCINYLEASKSGIARFYEVDTK